MIHWLSLGNEDRLSHLFMKNTAVGNFDHSSFCVNWRVTFCRIIEFSYRCHIVVNCSYSKQIKLSYPHFSIFRLYIPDSRSSKCCKFVLFVRLFILSSTTWLPSYYVSDFSGRLVLINWYKGTRVLDAVVLSSTIYILLFWVLLPSFHLYKTSCLTIIIFWLRLPFGSPWHW